MFWYAERHTDASPATALSFSMDLHRTCLALTAIVCASPASIALAQRRSPSPPRIDRSCMVELSLRSWDTLAVSIPLPNCGDLRLVSDGPAITARRGNDGFSIPIAFENAGTDPIRTPLEVQIDSVTQVRDGRQIASFFSRGFYEIAFWEGQVMQAPWRVGPSTEPAPPRGKGGTPSSLPPGKRSGSATIRLSVSANARTLRLWVGLRGFPRPDVPDVFVASQPARYPLDSAARSLIAAIRFPKLRDSVGLYRDPSHGLLIFSASFGEPQDCPSGCFYSNALGISYRGRAGWLVVNAYGDTVTPVRAAGRMFAANDDDAYLFALFLGPTEPRFGAADAFIHAPFLSNLLHSPVVPRALLQRRIDSLFGHLNQYMATLLFSLPTVRRDAGLLTSLAFLPNGGPPYEEVRAAALRSLRALATQLVQKPNTPAWTLFALALSISHVPDSALAGAIANHPNARRNPATLTVLAEKHPYLRARAVASVRASPRVRAELGARFAAAPSVPGLRSGREMLLDPEIRGNPDALRLLANLTLSRDTYIVYDAERLLPDTDFLRWAPRYTPIPIASNGMRARSAAPETRPAAATIVRARLPRPNHMFSCNHLDHQILPQLCGDIAADELLTDSC
jgi:hypothetical protein